MTATLCWVLLTMGDRPEQLAAAIDSLLADGQDAVVVVDNGNGSVSVDDARVTVIDAGTNLGVPGGRHLGVSSTESDLIGFLDDDAVVMGTAVGERLRSLFASDPTLGAVSLGIIDEEGERTRRHVPRAGERSGAEAGPAATFLGGACAIRRSAYEAAGGYWSELFYAHEELDLSWRLHDHGFGVLYAPDIAVRHPRTPISRHPDGWRRTGRNRVLVARRNLPWPVALPHVTIWLALGLVRASGPGCRRAYASGWLSGWRGTVPRRAIGWRTMVRLARAGRVPLI